MFIHDRLIKNKESILDKAESLGLIKTNIVIPLNGLYPSLLVVDTKDSRETAIKSCTQLQEHIQDLGFIGVNVLLKSTLQLLIDTTQNEAREEYMSYAKSMLALDSLDSSKHDFDAYLLGSIN